MSKQILFYSLLLLNLNSVFGARKSGAQDLAAVARSNQNGVVEIVTAADFDSKVTDSQTDRLIIAKFYSPTCGHCIAFKPHFERLSQTLSADADFIAINVDNLVKLAQEFKIMGVPAVVYFKNGKEIARASKADRKTITADVEKFKTSSTTR